MNATRRATLRAAVAPLLMACGVPPARAQAWPDRLLTIIVSWPPANPLDVMARQIAPLMTKNVGKPVIVENFIGAGGTIGVGRAAALPADGHTLLVCSPTEMILSPLTIPSVKYAPEDFRMVAFIGRAPNMLVTRPDLAQRTLAEVMALKDKPGAKPLTIGNIGPGSLLHLNALKFAQLTGLAVTHVPYKGVPPMLQDVMAGHLDLAFLPVHGSTMVFVEQGKIRALGITASASFPLYPALKTLAAGSPVFDGFEVDTWAAAFVRKPTPQAVAERLNQVLYQAMADPSFSEWARGAGSSVLAPPMTVSQLDTLFQAEIVRYRALAKLAPPATS